MFSYSQQALGQVVRRLREREGLTQAELGSSAGYGAGAGVSISRLESGQLRPSPEKLSGIAAGLGLTLEGLERLAAEHTAAVAAAPPPPVPVSASASGGASAPPGQKELNARSEAVTAETARRAQLITELSEAYNEQYDRARNEFLLPFDALGARLEGAPRIDPALLQDESADEGDAATSLVGSAPSIRERAGKVASGRAGTVGIAGLALAGIALMPAAALLGGGLMWKVRRDRRQRAELAAQLDEAEAALAGTASGIEALQQALPKATATLDYIATHAGHALTRWSAQLSPGPMTWASLAEADRRRYEELLEVATAQSAIVTFDFQGLLTVPGTEREVLALSFDDPLDQALTIVRGHV